MIEIQKFLITTISPFSLIFLIIYIFNIALYFIKTPIDIFTSKLRHNTKNIIKRNTKELIYFIFLGFVGLHILNKEPKEDLKNVAILNTLLYISLPISIYILVMGY